MTLNKRISLVVLAALFVLFLAGMQRPALTGESTNSNLFFNYEIVKYPSSAEIIPAIPGKNITIGVDISPDNLNFGIIPGNGSVSTRFINVTNLQADAKICLEATGSIKPYVGFDKNYFNLKSNEKADITIYFNTTYAGVGNYSGYIYLVVERPKYDFF
jgi:hypothetical protein